jgi:hypothetical protein
MRHEIGATFGYEWRGGIRVSVSGGAVADGLGVPGETRWSPSVGLQFEINPTALHQRRMAATPRRVGGAAVVTIPEAVRSEYRDAVGTLSGDDAEVQAQAAEDLASRLRSAAGISGGRNQLGRISTDSHFTAALRALDGGNLEEGIRELRQIPAFRDLETNPPTEPRTQDREQDSVGPGGFAIPRAEE